MSDKPVERYEDTDLYRIRHSAAHVMAEAVLELFPQAKYTIGPPIENGFYYDFDLPRPLTPEDLEKIEKRMRQIIAGDHRFNKRIVTPDLGRRVVDRARDPVFYTEWGVPDTLDGRFELLALHAFLVLNRLKH